MAKTKSKTTSDAIKIIEKQFGIDLERDPEMSAIAEDFRIGQLIYDARQETGITQQQLAETVGTTQSVISQLESAEYSGHSLTMLRRIAAALDRRVEIRFTPVAKQ
jgi:ribosome-binding protein aMBF1 (putative translation factor)